MSLKVYKDILSKIILGLFVIIFSTSIDANIEILSIIIISFKSKSLLNKFKRFPFLSFPLIVKKISLRTKLPLLNNILMSSLNIELKGFNLFPSCQSVVGPPSSLKDLTGVSLKFISICRFVSPSSVSCMV